MVAQSGNDSRGQFKRAVCQDTNTIAAIKECLNFRGPPDALRGDEIYERVRAQAKETLDAVYSDSPSSTMMQGGGGGGMVGIGSGSYGSNPNSGYTGGGSGGMPVPGGMGPSSGHGGGPKKMEGIGNPMFKDPRMESAEVNVKTVGKMSIGEIAGAAMEGFAGIIKDPLARNVGNNAPMPNRNVGSGYNPGGMPGYGNSSGGWKNGPPGQQQLSNATNGQWTMASNRGPSAIGATPAGGGGGYASWSNPPTSSVSSKPSVASQARMAAHNTNTPVTGSISGSGGVAASDGTYERNLIKELCPPGGMRAEPPPDKLRTFTQAVPSLNPDLVCPALLDALEDGQPWIIRAKALCVMEVTINIAEEHRKDGQNNAYADFFHACMEEIEPLVHHTRLAVRDPAKRVLKALGIDVQSTTESSATKSTINKSVSAEPAPSLLDFGEDPTPPPIPDAVPPPPPTMEPPAVPPELPPAAPPSSALPESASTGASLFGGMTVKSGTSTTVPTSTTNPLPPTVQNSQTEPKVETILQSSPDLLGGEEIESSKIEIKASNGGNDNVADFVKSLGDSSGPSGSAFGFMNTNETNSNGIASSTSHPVKKESFDPLLSLSGPTSATTNQTLMQQQQVQQPSINPQVASAYQQQQQILMMQMQMQQMQMAQGGMPQAHMNNMQKSGPNKMMGGRVPVMGGANLSAASTTFAFMDDPAKVQKEASNKKFDFVMDAMKHAK